VQQRRKHEKIVVSLRGAYRDLIVFPLFLGLIFTSMWTPYYYVAYRETFYLMIAFVTRLLFMLAGVARFVFVVESWRKRRRKEN